MTDSNAYEIGDLVRLKGGGPVLTVTGHCDREEFIDHQGNLVRGAGGFLNVSWFSSFVPTDPTNPSTKGHEYSTKDTYCSAWIPIKALKKHWVKVEGEPN